MKVTVLEYEEDPSVVKPNNDGSSSTNEGFPSSQLLLCEHTIDLNVIKTSGDGNSSNYTGQATSHRRNDVSYSKSLIESPIRVVRQLFLGIDFRLIVFDRFRRGFSFHLLWKRYLSQLQSDKYAKLHALLCLVEVGKAVSMSRLTFRA